MVETDWGKLGLVLMGGVMPNKSLVQFFVDGHGCTRFCLCSPRVSFPSPVEVL